MAEHERIAQEPELFGGPVPGYPPVDVAEPRESLELVVGQPYPLIPMEHSTEGSGTGIPHEERARAEAMEPLPPREPGKIYDHATLVVRPGCMYLNPGHTASAVAIDEMIMQRRAGHFSLLLCEGSTFRVQTTYPADGGGAVESVAEVPVSRLLHVIQNAAHTETVQFNEENGRHSSTPRTRQVDDSGIEIPPVAREMSEVDAILQLVNAEVLTITTVPQARLQLMRILKKDGMEDYESLPQGNVSIRESVLQGARAVVATFPWMEGRDMYDRIVENLRRYEALVEEITLQMAEWQAEREQSQQAHEVNGSATR
jgi:hypothetical protein